MKRLLALLLAIVITVCFTACKGGAASNPSPDNGGEPVGGSNTVNLAYNSADTFNPYTAATLLNRNLCSLIFDPLIKIDADFNAVNILAAVTELVGDTCTVTLETAYFSDGSMLTADDVVYSFNLAKSSTGSYKAMLSEVVSAEARDGSSVIFKFQKADPNAVNLLTFPIIKIGTDQLKNEDNVYLPPVGCGRYTLNADHTGLVSNKNWHGGAVNIGEINLINAPDKESLAHSVEIGAIDYYYTDLSDCNIIRMSGERVNVALNNLVYIGINMNLDYLNNSYMRHAISAAINRNAVCEQGYYNNALPASGLFNPKWNAVSGIQTIENSANQKIAIENLDEIGYNSKDDNGYYINSAGKTLALTLLVNSENAFRLNAAKLIAAQLGAVGIKLNVKAVSYAEYTELLAAGQFELYIAEVNITDNMDISPLVTEGGAVAYGIKKSTDGDATETMALSNVISAYYSGTGNVTDVAVTAISEMPVIPVCYRMGVLFCSEKIEANNAASADDIFFGFENINIK